MTTRALSLSALILLAPALACGPGAIGSGETFGGGTGEDTTGDEDSASGSATTASGTATNTSSSSSTTATTTDTDSDTDDTDSDTDNTDTEDTATTDTDSDTDDSDTDDSWTDSGDDGEPPAPDNPPACERSWAHVDTIDSHGHIGNTPIAAPPTGGLLTVNPLLGGLGDDVNVDAWLRRWSPQGQQQWENLISWAEERDDIQDIDFDELGTIFVGGRLDANQGTERAMVARLSGEGQPEWLHTYPENGGFSQLFFNGGAVIVAGELGAFGSQRMTLAAFDPDTGEELWFAQPEMAFGAEDVRGMAMADGFIYILANANAAGRILRFDPPETEPVELAALDSAASVTDLARFGNDHLAALYFAGSPVLGIIDRDNGELEVEIELNSIGLGELSPEAIIQTAAGLAVAGDINDDDESATFLVQFDEDLEISCVGGVRESELGLNHTLDLRGLALGSEGEIYTGSYLTTPRSSVLVRWD